MTREQVRDKVIELTRSLSLEELEDLVQELFDLRVQPLSEEQRAELEAAREEIARGEGIVVEDVDAFIDELERSTPEE